MRRTLVFAAVGVTALLCAAAVRATAYAPDAARTAARLPREQREERAFIRAIAGSARFETEAAKLVLQRSQNAGVRAWASELLNHQQAAHAELMHLLHSRAMAMPMLENDQRKALSRLGKLSGPRFDRDFMETVALRQQRDKVQMFEKAQPVVADPVLKAWIDRQLPTLRFQLVAAERLGSEGRSAIASKGQGSVPGGARAGVAPAAHTARTMPPARRIEP